MTTKLALLTLTLTLLAGCGSQTTSSPTQPGGTQTLASWGVSSAPHKHRQQARLINSGPVTSPARGSAEMRARARATPTSVSGVAGTIVQVATSNSDTYALTSTGAVYASGNGARGELGNGTRPGQSHGAVKVDFPAGVTIARLANPSGLDGGLAIDTQGHAWAWGVNGGGQDCRGASGPLLRPVEVPLSHVTLAAGAFQHTVFDAGGTIVTCGNGFYGQLGNDTSGAAGVIGNPVAVHGLPSGKAVAVTASWGDAGVLMADGSYYDWGYNGGGQVGDGSTAPRTTAYRVPLPGAVVAAAQGGSLAVNGQSMVLLADGQLWEWGNGRQGQMGDGQLVNETRPIRLVEPAGVDFVKIASGGATNYAIDSEGMLWGWGRDNFGQVGDGRYRESVNRPVPDHVHATQVASTASVVAALVNSG